MTRFSSPGVALAYAVLAGMGVVALLVWSGRLSEATVQRFVLPPVLLTLAAVGIWELRRRADDGPASSDDGA